MRNVCSLLSLTLLVGMLLDLSARSAYAYIDPGTSSYLLQITFGALLAGAFVAKTFWTRIKNNFARIFRKKQSKAK